MKYIILEDGRVFNECSGALQIAKMNAVRQVGSFEAEAVEFEKPRKTVTKEAPLFKMDYGRRYYSFHVPGDAKNVRCFYDVEE